MVGLILWGACPELALAQQPGQTPAPFTPPPQRRVDPFEQFRKSGPLPAPVVAAEQAWRLTLGVLPSAGGAIDEARVYIPMRDALLIALDRETGLLQWIRDVNTELPPVVADGTVYVAASGAIRALDAETGEDLWQTPLAAKVVAPMTWDTGWLVAMVEPGEVVAMRAADGEILWRRPLGAVSPHPAVPGGRRAIYFSLADGRVVALSLTEGAVLWEQKVPGTLSEPATARERVFVGSTDNAFYALDDESGAVEWKWRGGGDVIGAAVDGDVVYYASLDNVIRAVNRGNGNQRWRKETGTRPVLPPRAFGGTVVVPGLMPAMAAFVGKTGQAMGTYAASGHLIGPPLIDTSLNPMRVSFVTITREGVVEAMRATGLALREAAGTPLTALPGRQVARERPPE
jgi:outer membrane protein assembly factor BamB